MTHKELLEQTIEIVESYIEGEPNMAYYPSIYKSNMEILEGLKKCMLTPDSKFVKNDKVYTDNVRPVEENLHISLRLYNPDGEGWRYTCPAGQYFHYLEDELKKVENKNGN